MAVVYSIRDWDEHFECAQSRKRKRSHNWVSTPTKHDGKSFRRIMLMDDGLAIYGAWMLIVQIAAKCPIRGVLADKDGPLDSEDLAIKTGAKSSAFEAALKVLSDTKIGWMMVQQWERSSTTVPLQDKTEQDQPTNQPTAAHSASRSVDANGSGRSAGRPVRCSETWECVAERLVAFGVERGAPAIDSAKNHGLSPGHAHSLIDFAHGQNFGPGALVDRLKNGLPTMAVNRGWTNAEAPSEAEAKRQAVDQGRRDKQAAEARDAEATHVVKECRRRGIVTDEGILAELKKLGLEWPK